MKQNVFKKYFVLNIHNMIYVMFTDAFLNAKYCFFISTLKKDKGLKT